MSKQTPSTKFTPQPQPEYSLKNEMIIKVYINNLPYEIDCDTGIQDVAWLALCACQLHGQSTYPVTNYIPIMARNKSGEILHPKLVLLQYRDKIGKEIDVKVRQKFPDGKRKKGAIEKMTEDEREWYFDAFLEGRFMQTVNMSFKPSAENIKKDYQYRIEFKFEIEEYLKPYFPDMKNVISCTMKETSRKGEYEGKIKVPFGSLVQSRIIYCSKDNDTWDRETTDFIKNDLTLEKTPKLLSPKERENYLRAKEDAIRAKEIKIKQDIINAERAKQEEHVRMINLREYMSQIPFSLEEIYDYTQHELTMSEQNLVEIFELLERNEYSIFRKLFEIFNDYCKFYDNNTVNNTYANPNDIILSIDGLAETNFLTTFFEGRDNLGGLAEEFHREYISRFEKDASEINFKEFIYIIIFLLNGIAQHKSVTITTEIEMIYQTHEEKLKSKSFKTLFKNNKVNKIINEHHEVLRDVFEKYGVKKEKTEMTEMDNIRVDKLYKDLAEKMKVKYEIINTDKALSENKVYDFFEFLRLIIDIAINLDENGNSVETSLERVIDYLKIVLIEK
jgi:hypothetical protein